MPSSLIKSFAKKSGKSEEDVERLFKKIKQSVKDGGTSETDESFHARVVGGLKRGLKIESKIISFKEYLQENINGKNKQ